MRVALLLGIPAGYVGTAKSAVAKSEALFSAWSIKYIPSNRKEPEILEGMVGKLKKWQINTKTPNH